jgi:hypothetical protein
MKQAVGCSLKLCTVGPDNADSKNEVTGTKSLTTIDSNLSCCVANQFKSRAYSTNSIFKESGQSLVKPSIYSR